MRVWNFGEGRRERAQNVPADSNGKQAGTSLRLFGPIDTQNKPERKGSSRGRNYIAAVSFRVSNAVGAQDCEI
jgi:hypothetical protein